MFSYQSKAENEPRSFEQLFYAPQYRSIISISVLLFDSLNKSCDNEGRSVQDSSLIRSNSHLMEGKRVEIVENVLQTKTIRD